MSVEAETEFPNRGARVTLQEVTAETVRAITDLRVLPGQEKFVASNAVSIAQAFFEPKAWFRAVYADETPVGFVMLYEDTDKPEYYLWRFMIDGRYQHLGFGEQALKLLIDHVRSRPGARELLLSYFPAEGSPEGFYARQGFTNTGKLHGDEKEMRLAL